MSWSGIEAACKSTESEISREINLINRELLQLKEKIEEPKRIREMKLFFDSIRPTQKILNKMIKSL